MEDELGIEASEAGRQRDRRQRGALIEGPPTDAREAGGQCDRRYQGAAPEGAPNDAREAGGQLNRRHLPSSAGPHRRMALGGTWANLRMLSSKPAGSSIDVNEEQPEKAE